METTAAKSTALTSPNGSEPVKLRSKRIGSTVFIVNVHFSEMSTEKLENILGMLLRRALRPCP